MKCPRCGITNGKTNKFCRECGMKLEELGPASLNENGAAPDDVALGEELYDVWKLYEAGDYDIALGNCESILERYPESASAHSLIALVYERKAEAILEEGDPVSAKSLLKQALGYYERIIDLNPDSAGDREKIASLRMKLRGVAPSEPEKTPVGLKAVFKAIPVPWLAAMGTFLVALAFGVIFVSSGSHDEPVRANAKISEAPKLEVTTSLGSGRDSTPAPDSVLQVYTFPAPSSSSNGSRQSPPPPMPNPTPERSREIPDIEPQKLPGITLPLETKPKKPSVTVQEIKPAKVELPKVESAKKMIPTQSPKAVNGTAPADESSEKVAPRVTGSSLLAQAIESSRQGTNDEAIRLAQQAVGIFQSDIDAGRNVDAANRGIKNARNLIKIWQ